MRNLMFAAVLLLGHLYAHVIVINPEPMNLPFGGRDGSISLLIAGDEPSPNCQVTVSANSPTEDLISITKSTPQPAREVVVTVHALRQPQGESESAKVTGSWRGVSAPIGACVDRSFSFTLTVTVARSTQAPPTISSGGIVPLYSA